MTVRFYFDEHMRRAVADGLVQQGYAVVMAVDVEMVARDDDSEHLPYATGQGLVMVTFDRAFAGRTMSRGDHAGLIILSEKLLDNVGGIIRLLAAFAEKHTSEDVRGQVFWLK